MENLHQGLDVNSQSSNQDVKNEMQEGNKENDFLENGEKEKEIANNLQKALQEERKKRREYEEKLRTIEEKEREREMKKKGEYETLKQEYESKYNELKEKEEKYNEIERKEREREEKELETMLLNTREDDRDEIKSLIDGLPHEKQKKILEKFQIKAFEGKVPKNNVNIGEYDIAKQKGDITGMLKELFK